MRAYTVLKKYADETQRNGNGTETVNTVARNGTETDVNFFLTPTVKGLHSRVFFKFRSCTHGVFEELGRHAKRGGSHECPDCGACEESVEPVLF